MSIYDCCIYFDDDLVLDLRLNILDKYVDTFVIVEGKKDHQGNEKSLNFKIEKFEKFKNKIIYLIYNNEPEGIEIINEKDNHGTKSSKYILNAAKRENGQRNYISKGLESAKEDDIILISDVDEIPNVSNINFKNISEKIIMFRQYMFYYKFDLKIPDFLWVGTKACKKKNLLNPQWLRNIKDRKYLLFRPDILFSKTKYSSIKFIDEGGWHFSNIKSAEEIEYKLKSYLHHREFDEQPLSVQEINKVMKNKLAIYDLNVDKRVNKIGNGAKLEKFEFEKLPKYIQENKKKFERWLD